MEPDSFVHSEYVCSFVVVVDDNDDDEDYDDEDYDDDDNDDENFLLFSKFSDYLFNANKITKHTNMASAARRSPKVGGGGPHKLAAARCGVACAGL